MTPCEKIGLKVGDEVRLLERGCIHEGSSIGDIFILDEDDGTYVPFFLKKNSGNLGRDHRYCLRIPSNNKYEKWFEMTKTEAEKRGAKFGTMGVVKNSGKKCVYIGDAGLAAGSWEVALEGCVSTWSMPYSNIRLDHEPDFKEVPFRDATHEQRMIAENLRDEWGYELSDIFYSEKNNVYVILTKEGELDLLPPLSGRFTVRIPS